MKPHKFHQKSIEVLPELDMSYLISEQDSDLTPLLLLHGFTGSGHTMQELATIQTERTTICPDLIGHGMTRQTAGNNPDFFTFQSINKQLVNFLTKLDIQEVHILGYSMGGRIALNFTIECLNSKGADLPKIISLALISSTAGLKTLKERGQRRQEDGALIQLIQEEGLETFVNYWVELPIFGNHNNKTRPKQLLENNPDSLVASLRGCGLGEMDSLWDALPSASLPVLLITGSNDQKFAEIAKDMNHCFPNSEHIEIKDASHTPHLREPLIVGAALTNFLYKQENTPHPKLK